MTVQLAIPAATRIGWIGTGVMGSSMCGHLLTAGYRVTIHSRTRSKAQSLLDRGAQWAEHPRAVAAESDVLFTMVGFPQDVRTGLFRRDWSPGRRASWDDPRRHDDDGPCLEP